jgi:hypothetical protein
MATVKGEGKTAFLKDVLTKNNQANAEAVNEAWKAAGHEDTISESLVNKIRSQMGLAGNLRSRPKVTESAESAEQTAAPATRRGTGPKRVGGRSPAKGNGRHVPQVTESEVGPQGARSQSGGDDRTRVLTRLEGQIDEMLFEIKTAGGLPEFEEVLRKARRILARSHGE